MNGPDLRAIEARICRFERLTRRLEDALIEIERLRAGPMIARYLLDSVQCWLWSAGLLDLFRCAPRVPRARKVRR